MKDRSVDLPKAIELKNANYDGDLSLSAKESVSAENITVKHSLYATAGFQTAAEAKEVESYGDSIAEIIKKNFFNKYPCSTKLTLSIGKNGSCVTYTPDVDGVARDEEGDSAGVENLSAVKQHTYSIFKYAGSKEDLVDALSDTSKNIQVISAVKMR